MKFPVGGSDSFRLNRIATDFRPWHMKTPKSDDEAESWLETQAEIEEYREWREHGSSVVHAYERVIDDGW